MKIGDQVIAILTPEQVSKMGHNINREETDALVDEGQLSTRQQLDCVKLNIINYLETHPAPPGTPIDLTELTQECCPPGWDEQVVIDALTELYREVGLC